MLHAVALLTTPTFPFTVKKANNPVLNGFKPKAARF